MNEYVLILPCTVGLPEVYIQWSWRYLEHDTGVGCCIDLEELRQVFQNLPRGMIEVTMVVVEPHGWGTLRAYLIVGNGVGVR